jgi:hypothetical protein
VGGRLLALAAVWCFLLLGLQWRAAKRFVRRRLYAPPSGDPRAGVRYAFTGALLPWAKESVRENPAAYAAGILFHAGIAASAALAFATLEGAPLPLLRALAPLALLGGLAGLALLARRIAKAELRGLSSADDYASNLLATAFSLLAGASPFLPGAARLLPFEGAALLGYAPLGKIRHCAFFFLSRYHLGAFFGRRGTFPGPSGADHA